MTRSLFLAWVCLAALVAVGQCQNCFTFELFTMKAPVDPPVADCETGRTDEFFEVTVQGVVQPCLLTAPGDDNVDCAVEICDTSKVVVGVVSGSSTNGWFFQARVNGELLRANRTCEQQHGFAEPRCQCAARLNILDDDFSNGLDINQPGNREVVFIVGLDDAGDDNTGMIVAVSTVFVIVGAVGAAFYARRKRRLQEVVDQERQVVSKPPQGVGYDLQTPKVEFRRFIQSAAFSGAIVVRRSQDSQSQVLSYKSKASKDDEERLSFIKAQSSRYSTNIGQREAASMRSQDSSINRLSAKLYDKALEVIAKVCERIEVKVDDRYSADPFRQSEAPEVALNSYLYRLVKGLDAWFYDDPGLVLGVGVRSLLISLIYLKKIKTRVDDFRLTRFNQHRVFAVTMLIAAKFTEDCIIVNEYWAKIAGLKLEDLNKLETQFCSSCGFELYVKDEQVQEIYEEYDLGRIAGTPRNFISQRFSKLPPKI